MTNRTTLILSMICFAAAACGKQEPPLPASGTIAETQLTEAQRMEMARKMAQQLPPPESYQPLKLGGGLLPPANAKKKSD